MTKPNDSKAGDPRFIPVPGRHDSMPQGGAGGVGKVMIGSLDDPSLIVEAMWNPKELEVSRTVPWAKPNQANKSSKRGQQASSGSEQGVHLEFTGAEGRSLTLELLFDGYETEGDAKKKPVSVLVEDLEKMAQVRVPNSKKEEEKRPHHCIIVWGAVLPGFKCVIESLSTKYTMFSSDGRPLRATCTLKVKEADIVSVAKKK